MRDRNTVYVSRMQHLRVRDPNAVGGVGGCAHGLPHHLRTHGATVDVPPAHTPARSALIRCQLLINNEKHSDTSHAANRGTLGDLATLS